MRDSVKCFAQVQVDDISLLLCTNAVTLSYKDLLHDLASHRGETDRSLVAWVFQTVLNTIHFQTILIKLINYFHF